MITFDQAKQWFIRNGWEEQSHPVYVGLVVGKIIDTRRFSFCFDYRARLMYGSEHEGDRIIRGLGIETPIPNTEEELNYIVQNFTQQT